MNKTDVLISVGEAAEIAGLTERQIRVALKKGLFKPQIGFVIEPEIGRRCQYIIYRTRLINYVLGKDINLTRACKKMRRRRKTINCTSDYLLGLSSKTNLKPVKE